MSSPTSPASSLDTLRRADALVFVEDLDHPSLSEEDTHHLDVLRLSPNASVIASDGVGRWRLCTLERVRPEYAGSTRGRANRSPWQLEIREETTTEAEPRWPVTVGFGLQKGDRPEWTVQKLTELGVDTIVPLFTERTIVRLDAKATKARLERLQRVAREAASQSRRPRLPHVLLPVPLQDACRSYPHARFAEIGTGRPDVEVRCIFVGPEGGWSADELELAPGQIGLSNAVLRAETAAIAAGVLLCARRDETVQDAGGGANPH